MIRILDYFWIRHEKICYKKSRKKLYVQKFTEIIIRYSIVCDFKYKLNEIARILKLW